MSSANSLPDVIEIKEDVEMDESNNTHSEPTTTELRQEEQQSSNESKKDQQINSRKANSKERQNRQKYEQSEYVALLDGNGNPIPKSERKPKKKVAVMIGYCGTGYNGLQIQNDPNTKTIEKDLYEAFYKAGAISLENSIDLKKSGFQRCARTDKGVHAAGNVISLKLIIEDSEILKKINDNLPDQIRVWGIQRTTKGYDCRKMCSSRWYEYLLPTYSLISPKPGTRLAKLIDSEKEKYPNLFVDDDGESNTFWETTQQKVFESGISKEELDLVTKYYENSPEQNQDSQIENKTIENIVKKIKTIENQQRRLYRISSKKLDRFRNTMDQYKGSNNFHNFTIGKSFKDSSSKRFIIDTKTSEPFVINGTEWISIKIHGQSFMLHQIRKMICMACLILRLDLPSTLIKDCFKSTKINIPKAPSLGLLLEAPVFDAYNLKLKDHQYDIIDFSKFSKEMNEFKMKFIYDKIYGEEIKENSFYGFFGFIDNYKIPLDNEEIKNGNGGAGSITIFDFFHNYINEYKNDKEFDADKPIKVDEKQEENQADKK
ncbi:PUS1 [Candida pseudojiufengensis]|uniref:PUS1 n=1 Tax=Candida pseudojiufengensis TaxID=497109 RepID=UPI00222448A2|nr:PUS1 [Candida pseudojiufengensis]KAI5963144.1 PUS1 [Candida pseudojiufengensis]